MWNTHDVRCKKNGNANIFDKQVEIAGVGGEGEKAKSHVEWMNEEKTSYNTVTSPAVFCIQMRGREKGLFFKTNPTSCFFIFTFYIHSTD